MLLLRQMDRSWIPYGRPFSPTFNAGVEEFIEWVKQKFLEQKNPCPYTQCLNQMYTTWQEVKDHLLMNTMSPTYTTWIHHGEEGGGTDIIEPSDVHGSHHDGSIAEEE